jgi:hypothetical protein
LISCIASFTWKPIELTGFSVPGPLFGHSSVFYNGRLYIFGGMTQSHTFKFSDEPDHFGDEHDSDDEEKGLNTKRSSTADQVLLALGDGYSTGMSVRERLFFKSQGEEVTNDLYVFDTGNVIHASSSLSTFSYKPMGATELLW